MMRRNVEHLEVVEIEFDVWRVEDLEAHQPEDGVDFAQHQSGGMVTACQARPRRQGHVHALRAHALGQRGELDLLALGGKGAFHLAADGVNLFAERWALLLRSLADLTTPPRRPT
jgi:hypothetical protein